MEEVRPVAGVVSNLDEKHNDMIESIREELRKEFGLKLNLGTAHFSYKVRPSPPLPFSPPCPPADNLKVAENFAHPETEGGEPTISAVKERLEVLCKKIKPFKVRTASLGLFIKQEPSRKTSYVIYLPVVRTAELSEVQKTVWEGLEGIGNKVQGYYAPDRWMPHITLVHDEGTDDPEMLGKVVSFIAGRYTFDWELDIENITVSSQDNLGERQETSFLLQA